MVDGEKCVHGSLTESVEGLCNIVVVIKIGYASATRSRLCIPHKARARANNVSGPDVTGCLRRNDWNRSFGLQ